MPGLLKAPRGRHRWRRVRRRSYARRGHGNVGEPRLWWSAAKYATAEGIYPSSRRYIRGPRGVRRSTTWPNAAHAHHIARKRWRARKSD